MQKPELPDFFIDELASLAFTVENIQRANAYLAHERKLDPGRLTMPWAMLGADASSMAPLSRHLDLVMRPKPGRDTASDRYADCLFIPVLDPRYRSVPVLAGFDIRYCGPRKDRARFLKHKRTPSTPMIYGLSDAVDSPYGVLTESAIDAETVRQLGFVSISPMTALWTPAFSMLCYGFFERVYIMYDNDSNGVEQTRRMIEAIAKAGPQFAQSFIPIVYQGHDANDALRQFGADTLRITLEHQIY